jgi:hypothetical protein
MTLENFAQKIDTYSKLLSKGIIQFIDVSQMYDRGDKNVREEVK